MIKRVKKKLNRMGEYLGLGFEEDIAYYLEERESNCSWQGEGANLGNYKDLVQEISSEICNELTLQETFHLL